MKIILNTEESYSLTELAKAVENSPNDLFYVVKKVNGNDVSFAITRDQLLLGISGGGADSRFIISGGVVWTGTGLVFDVTAINYNFYGTTNITPAVQITLDNGDSDPRFDSFVVDVLTNTVVVIKGTPAANPQIPQPSEDQIFITSVLVGAGATTPTITNDFVYRDNADWTASTYTVGSPTPGTVDFESTNDPFEGTFCIDSNTSRSTGMRFQRTGSIELGTDTGQFSSLSFRIRFDTPLPANRNLLASVWLTGSTVGVTANFMPYGIDRNLVGVWQTIVIPTGIFSATEIDRIQIRMDGGTNAQQAEYFLDYIVFATGIVAPAQVPTITIQKDGTTIGNRPKLNFIEGANTTITVADSPTNDRVDITIAATGGGGGGVVVSVVGTADEIDVDNTDPANPILSLSAAVTTALAQAVTAVQSVQAGDNVTIDATDPQNPIVSVQASESGESLFFLEDEDDPIIAGYKVMDNPAQLEVESFVTQNTIADQQLIQSWITDVGLPGTTFIPSGFWVFKINAFKTGGTKEVRLYNEMYKRALDGTETLLGTTANSIALTDFEASIAAFNIYIEGFALLSTDRLVTKTRMRLIGGGSNPTSVTVGYSGTTAARLSIPSQGGVIAGGQVDSVVGTADEIDVDNTDPVNPVLSLAAAVLASLGLADTAVQPAAIADFLTEALLIGTQRSFAKAQWLDVTALTPASNIFTANLETGSGSYTADIGANSTFANPVIPSGYSTGKVLAWDVTCTITGAGGWTIAFGNQYRADDGVDLAALIAANSTTGDVIQFNFQYKNGIVRVQPFIDTVIP